MLGCFVEGEGEGGNGVGRGGPGMLKQKTIHNICRHFGTMSELKLPKASELATFPEAFSKLLEPGDGKKAPMEIFQDCMTCLKKFHKLQKLTLTADLFLTHRENRSSLMLDPVRVHQNILMIHKAADMKQLINAVAIEIAKENLEWKDKMLDANDQLIARSHCN